MVLFLKLGGALITDKHTPHSARMEVLAALCRELAAWPGLGLHRLVLAHGSGSFAHTAVQATGFQDHPGDAMAMATVAAAARRLNGLVMDELLAAGVPAVAVPGAVLAVCRNGAVVRVRSDIVRSLWQAGVLPVLYGDAAPDEVTGGAIASTEPLLVALAADLRPKRIVLATDVDGVYAFDPSADSKAESSDPSADPLVHTRAATGPHTRPIPVFTPDELPSLPALLGPRAGVVDVTGGMASKVRWMTELVAAQSGLEVRIVSGLRPGAVSAALDGRLDAGGTLIRRARGHDG